MASYPNSVPALGTLSGATFPQIAHVNNPADEEVALATELGVDPHVITDNVTPSASPASVAAYLDMLATIFKTASGRSNWYYSAVPARHVLVSHGGGAAVPVGGGWLGPGRRGFATTAGSARYVVTTPCKVLIHTLQVELLSAVASTPSDEEFYCYIEKNGTQLAPSITLGINSPAGIYRAGKNSTDYLAVSYVEKDFAVNDTFSFVITMNTGSAGPQIGCVSVQVIQNG